jgi:hypothetical protein
MDKRRHRYDHACSVYLPINIFVTSSVVTKRWLYSICIWLLCKDMACPFRRMSAHVVDSAVGDSGSKAKLRQSSFQTAVPPDTGAVNDQQQTLNLKHLSEAITTLTSPPVSFPSRALTVHSNAPHLNIWVVLTYCVFSGLILIISLYL